MPWSKWNAADRTLLFSAVMFFFGLCLHLEFPNNVFARGFLFCAEAALVGGIADWFAVTALFEKPLGFPYHTALLPRRRQDFIKASVTLVQKEFFSSRSILRHLKELHLIPMLLNYLSDEKTKEMLTHQLIAYARDFLIQSDVKVQSQEIAEKFRAYLHRVPADSFFGEAGRWMKKSGRDREILAKIARFLRKRVEEPEFSQGIEVLLQEFEQKKAGMSWKIALMLGFAESLDIVNMQEISKLLQKECLEFLDELSDEESELTTEILELFYQKSEELGAWDDFLRELDLLKTELISGLPLAEAAERLLLAVQEDFVPQVAEDGSTILNLHSELTKVFGMEYSRMVKIASEDEKLMNTVQHILEDILAQSVMRAQALIGTVVESVLGRMTDEQLNHLVYDKVEQDMIWIRMNGSLIGSGIGLLIFTILELIR